MKCEISKYQEIFTKFRSTGLFGAVTKKKNGRSLSCFDDDCAASSKFQFDEPHALLQRICANQKRGPEGRYAQGKKPRIPLLKVSETDLRNKKPQPKPQINPTSPGQSRPGGTYENFSNNSQSTTGLTSFSRTQLVKKSASGIGSDFKIPYLFSTKNAKHHPNMRESFNFPIHTLQDGDDAGTQVSFYEISK